MILDAIEKIKKVENDVASAEKDALINGEKLVEDARLEADKILKLAKKQGEEYIQKAISDAEQIASGAFIENSARIEEEIKGMEEKISSRIDITIEKICERLISD